MFAPTIEDVIAMVSLVIGAVAGYFKLDNKVNTNNARVDSLKELINARFNSVEDRLERIEASIDASYEP